MDNLEGLRDIHLPPLPTRFPLGWGIWISLFLILLLIFLAPTFRKLYLKSKKRYALKILNSINQKDVAALCKISEILRRTCLIKHKDAVTLSGADWAIFLNKHSHTKIEKSLLSLLVDAPYMPESKQITADDFDKIKNFALSFVEDNL